MKQLRQLLELRNILPILTIIVAFSAASGLLDQIIPANKSNSIILALLGILAIDSLTERLGYLRRIENTVNSIRAGRATPSFVNRAKLNESESFEHFLGRTNQDMLVSGLTLVGVTGPHYRLFEKLLKSGVRLRFLLLDPNSPHIDYVASFLKMTPETIRHDIQSSLGHLKRLLSSASSMNTGLMQIRFYSTVPNASIIAIDGKFANGEIRYEMLVYGIDVGERPTFCIKAIDGDTYQLFHNTLEDFWNASPPATL